MNAKGNRREPQNQTPCAQLHGLAPPECSSWPDRLQSTLDELNGPLNRILVLRETDSTQDAARRMSAMAGDVITAARQTAGRGRLGRAWADTGDEGIAVTMVVDPASLGCTPPRLAIAGAIGAARAAEALLYRRVGIKWPNDIIADGRKLAGVLIEASGTLAYLGVGMNIAQTDWPDDLRQRAVSLMQFGAACSRVEAIEALLRGMNAALELPCDDLAAEFAARDVLRGTTARFKTPAGVVSGLVERIEPSRGLLVRAADGEIWLDAATTSVLP